MIRASALAAWLAACRGPDPLPGDGGWTDPAPPALPDADPDPLRFEGELVARETEWWPVPGVPVRGLAFADAVPGPLVRVPAGARVSIRVENQLPAGFDTTVHWHGIEGNNAADGTPVTQAAIHPGEAFAYSFVAPRPGLHWYHPHTRGAQAVFEGLYAPLVVEDPDEAALIERGVLPADERVLVLSDVTARSGAPVSVEIDNAMERMNGTEGEWLLVNGKVGPVFEAGAGGAVRLRVLNASITRFWRLSVPGRPLHRVGGEGGLLDRVRLEGGTRAGRRVAEDGTDLGPADIALGYDRGEILLGPGDRADLVLVLDGEPGDEIPLLWRDWARGRHDMWMDGGEMVMGDAEDDGLRPDRAVATFRLTDAPAQPWTFGEGDPVLEAIGRQVGPAPAATVSWGDDRAMVLSERMDMVQDGAGTWQMDTELLLDGVSWHPDHGGPDQPFAPSAVVARLGDVLAWQVRNDSAMAHPVHLHGFSYQVVGGEQVDEDGTVVQWTADHDEYEDTTVLPGHASITLRVPIADPVGDGRAVGRWMRHCHILQHGEGGMMSELVVEP